MNVTPTALPEVLLVEPKVFGDRRGFFLETYHQEKYQAAGIDVVFVQDNHSFSARNTLRGLHAQTRKPQGKLIRVIAGSVFDVAVDIRPTSPRFGQWVGVELNATNNHQLYVPPGFAHGFCVLSESAHFLYKCTDVYDPDFELCIRWDDPDLGVAWPVSDVQLSDKDERGLTLAQAADAVQCFAPLYG
ncbi:MAG: dTDP-4-dehydrorhamnose 3,5-epimerase [Gammaproteobacteria bacterium]|nr:dTDP-4-dehydrorhamnose 3,5-epimerase [Gammaproteobacteria bacterium]